MMGDKPELQREIEHKFDISKKANIDNLLRDLEKISKKENWKIESKSEEKRKVKYYDTPELLAYNRGQTIREVTKYNDDGCLKSRRYDFKKGSIKNREEANYYSDNELSIEDILKKMPIGFSEDEDSYSGLMHIATANTTHRKIMLSWNTAILEIKIDYFDVVGGTEFMELELELKEIKKCSKKASIKKLDSLRDSIKDKLGKKYGMTSYYTQKYNRVIGKMVMAYSRTLN